MKKCKKKILMFGIICVVLGFVDIKVLAKTNAQRTIGSNTEAVQIGNVIYYVCNTTADGTSGIRAYNIRTHKNTAITKNIRVFSKIENLTYVNGYLYYITYVVDDYPYYEVARINIKTNKKEVVHREISNYFINNNKIYYLNNMESPGRITLYQSSLNGKRKRKIASFYMKGNYIYESFISDGIIYYSTKFISDNREKYYAISVDKFKQKSISKKSFFKQYNTTKIYTSNKKNYYTRILVKDKSFMSRENNYRNAYSAYVIKDNVYYTDDWYRIIKKKTSSGEKCVLKKYKNHHSYGNETTTIIPVGNFFIIKHFFKDSKNYKYTWTLVKTNGQKVKKLYELEKCKS